ncbi:MAG: hypothetical protein ACFB0G_13340, partial [Leptolyngbyaceae cyanobacterium]
MYNGQDIQARVPHPIVSRPNAIDLDRKGFAIRQPILKFAMHPYIPLIVSPRERFSHTRQALDSLYAITVLPFQLVYVDGCSPRQTR